MLEERLSEFVEEARIRGEEFFLTYQPPDPRFDGEDGSGGWCAGFMLTPGLVPEMDISVEEEGETPEEALAALREVMVLTRPERP